MTGGEPPEGSATCRQAKYFLAALADVAPNEWLDAVFLERVTRRAVPVTIRPGEQKVQSLQIRGGYVPRR